MPIGLIRKAIKTQEKQREDAACENGDRGLPIGEKHIKPVAQINISLRKNNICCETKNGQYSIHIHCTLYTSFYKMWKNK